MESSPGINNTTINTWKQQFQEDGYFVVKNILSENEIETVKKTTHRTCQTLARSYARRSQTNRGRRSKSGKE